MTTDPDTWKIRVTASSTTRLTWANERLGEGEEGAVVAGVAESMCSRGSAVRLDGCQAETSDGTPCTRDASEDEYCHQHAPSTEGGDGE